MNKPCGILAICATSVALVLLVPFALSLASPGPVDAAKAKTASEGWVEKDVELLGFTTSGGPFGHSAEVRLQAQRDNRTTAIRVNLRRPIWSRTWTVLDYSEDPPKLK